MSGRGAGIGLVALLAASPAASAEVEARLVTYSALDITHDSVFLSGGTDYTLAPPLHKGAILRLQAAYGASRYTSALSPSGNAITLEQSGRMLIGQEIALGGARLRLFAGIDMHDRRALPSGADAATGSRIGPAVAADLWWDITPQAVLAGHALWAAPFQSWSARLAPGWRTPYGPVIGPEIAAGGHDGSARLMAGLHLTGLTIGPVDVRLSAGQAFDPASARQGLYGSLNVWKMF